LRQPAGPGIREDSGVYEGWRVPIEYDPMLSKLIVHASDRGSAIARMKRALDEYFIGGIKSNLTLFQRILAHPDFVAAKMDTGFLDRMLTAPGNSSGNDVKFTEIAAISAALFAATGNGHGNGSARVGPKPAPGPVQNDGWKRTARMEALRSQ
jgi:acetyl-CoA carboxylase biotin carboxylase subunit